MAASTCASFTLWSLSISFFKSANSLSAALSVLPVCTTDRVKSASSLCCNRVTCSAGTPSGSRLPSASLSSNAPLMFCGITNCTLLSLLDSVVPAASDAPAADAADASEADAGAAGVLTAAGVDAAGFAGCWSPHAAKPIAAAISRACFFNEIILDDMDVVLGVVIKGMGSLKTENAVCAVCFQAALGLSLNPTRRRCTRFARRPGFPARR